MILLGKTDGNLSIFSSFRGANGSASRFNPASEPAQQTAQPTPPGSYASNRLANLLADLEFPPPPLDLPPPPEEFDSGEQSMSLFRRKFKYS